MDDKFRVVLAFTDKLHAAEVVNQLFRISGLIIGHENALQVDGLEQIAITIQEKVINEK